jgi:hypothetical protein
MLCLIHQELMGAVQEHNEPNPSGICLAIRETRSELVRVNGGVRGEEEKMRITSFLKSSVIAAVVAGALLMMPFAANARVFISAGFAPPAIPIYTQPLCPGYGYIWTPGYWAYGDAGYYWVDGAWVEPPYEDALWTPGYWGWGDGAYLWNPGYWGLSIGYYGGINYGFGYFGTGFWGGYWHGGRFFYNGAYNHLGFHNGFVYNHPVAGFDGRPGGAAFAHNQGGAFNHGENFNRGAGINGSNFANRGGTQQVNYRNGFNANGARPQYNVGAARSFNGGNSFAQSRGNSAAPQAHSFSGGAQPQTHSFSGGAQPQARAFSGGGQPQAHSFSGGAQPQAHASYGGGGFHGGGGGGHR